MEMYQAVLSEEKARVFVDQIFTKFDTDNSGEIDFKVSDAFIGWKLKKISFVLVLS